MLESLAKFITQTPCVSCTNFNGPACEKCLHTVFVPRTPSCFACNKLTENGLTCPTCRSRHYIARTIACFRLDEPLKQLIHTYKYEHDRSLASFFAEQMRPFVADLTGVVSFVPATGARQRQRGFNQSQLLARALFGSTTELALRKAHVTQVGQSREARLASVADNFYIPRPDKVLGKEIILVDDVLTTGATLDELARELKSAGARRVTAVVLARA